MQNAELSRSFCIMHSEFCIFRRSISNARYLNKSFLRLRYH